MARLILKGVVFSKRTGTFALGIKLIQRLNDKGITPKVIDAKTGRDVIVFDSKSFKIMLEGAMLNNETMKIEYRGEEI